MVVFVYLVIVEWVEVFFCFFIILMPFMNDICIKDQNNYVTNI